MRMQQRQRTRERVSERRACKRKRQVAMRMQQRENKRTCVGTESVQEEGTSGNAHATEREQEDVSEMSVQEEKERLSANERSKK